MSAPEQSANTDQSAVFETASGSPLAASATAEPGLAISPGLESGSLANSAPDASESAPEASASAPEASASAREASASAPDASAPAPAASVSATDASASALPAPAPAPATFAPTARHAPVATHAPRVNEAPKRTAKQRGSDESVMAFRSRVNPIYLDMFKNLPPSSRPKGIPVTVARQAIQMTQDEQDRLIKNVADERRNAIEVKLGRKTRKVNPSTLKDVESILRMSEKSLISQYPDQRPLIRTFGRETRKVARNYTGEMIATLVAPRKSVAAVTAPAPRKSVDETIANFPSKRKTQKRGDWSSNVVNANSARNYRRANVYANENNAGVNSRLRASAANSARANRSAYPHRTFRNKNNVSSSLEAASPPQYNE